MTRTLLLLSASVLLVAPVIYAVGMSNARIKQ